MSRKLLFFHNGKFLLIFSRIWIARNLAGLSVLAFPETRCVVPVGSKKFLLGGRSSAVGPQLGILTAPSRTYINTGPVW
jgi:hypothetical protein